MKTKMRLASLFVLLLFAKSSMASDEADLEATLLAFLAAVDQKATHQRFWAEDLVYTSSSGMRFGKSEILAGFDEQKEGPSDQPVSPVYSAEDIDIRIYGDAAVLAFRLVARPDESAVDQQVLQYFNTGTFMKREGIWVAVAWQATAIPGATIEK